MKEDKLNGGNNKKENNLSIQHISDQNNSANGGNNTQYRKQYSNGGFNTMPLPSSSNNTNGYHNQTNTNTLNSTTPSSAASSSKDGKIKTINSSQNNVNGNCVDTTKANGSGFNSNTKYVFNGISFNSMNNNEDNTWIHELFQGTLVNETKCLNCESVRIASDAAILLAC